MNNKISKRDKSEIIRLYEFKRRMKILIKPEIKKELP